MNVVDSSGWLEYFSNGPNAHFFVLAIEAVDRLIVPTINLYEVFKHTLLHRSEADALQAWAHMRKGHVVAIGEHLAVEAARTSVSLKLPMADSLILATALQFGATLWTQDADFSGMRGVRYISK